MQFSFIAATSTEEGLVVSHLNFGTSIDQSRMPDTGPAPSAPLTIEDKIDAMIVEAATLDPTPIRTGLGPRDHDTIVSGSAGAIPPRP